MSNSDSNAAVSTSIDLEAEKVILDSGLATRNEITLCREQQKQSSDPNQRSLTDLLLENAFITTTQATRLRLQMPEVGKKSQIPGYEMLGKVGKGAMANVYKARQVSLDRIVAMKVLPKRLSENPEFVERLYKEGRAAARLSHNNIVQAIDVGLAPEGFHYFVMEYVDGQTLYDLMQKGKSFSEAEALDIIIQICDALHHAHERNLVHRDVKPKNIMLTGDGAVKLTDLGLARAMDDKKAAESEAGKAYGTPYYISPEQIRGDVDIDFRADIYSLGATLYHMVTGRPPFDGDTPSAVMHKHLKQVLVPADHVNTGLSSGIGEIIDVAMAKKRDERYHSTLDMLEDLRAVRAGQLPTHARRVVDLDQLARLEETGKTVDIAPAPSQGPWDSPLTITLMLTAIGSVLVNLILLILLLVRR